MLPWRSGACRCHTLPVSCREQAALPPGGQCSTGNVSEAGLAQELCFCHSLVETLVPGLFQVQEESKQYSSSSKVPSHCSSSECGWSCRPGRESPGLFFSLKPCQSCLLPSTRRCGCQQPPWPASAQRSWPREQRREGEAAARGQQGCCCQCHCSGAEGGCGIQARQGSTCLGEWNWGTVVPQQLNCPSPSCSHCSFVLEELKFLPTDEKSRDHKARCLWFLDTLIKFSHQKVIKKKRKRVFSS